MFEVDQPEVQAKTRAAMITQLSAKVGEPWISFYDAVELQALMNKYGFEVTDNQIFKLDHFLTARSKASE